MFQRPSEGLAFLTILFVCTAGALKISWWAAVLGACALVMISLHGRWNAPTRAVRARAVSDPIQLAASSLNGAAIAGASFAFGQATAWAWGI
jgi:hypothetical protein